MTPSLDEVVAALEEAKRKLAEAKATGLRGVSLLGKATHAVGHALGRSGRGSPLLAQLAAKERALVERLVALDALAGRLDAAIAQARTAARPGGAPPNGPLAGPAVIPFDSGSKSAWLREVNRPLRPDAQYVEKTTGYTFDTDGIGRVAKAHGSLMDDEGDRNSYQQRVVGGGDREPTDDGGHFLAMIFRGPGERINLTPMNSNLNRGAWKAMENTWSAALRRGHEVKVTIDVKYEEDSHRAVRFIVAYQIGDEPPRRRTFKNSPGGT